MKAFGLMICAWLTTGTLHAAVVEVNKSALINKSSNELYSILADFKNTCDKGCKYRLQGLMETIVIEDAGNEQYVWQRIAGIRETKQFVHMQVAYNDGGQVESFTSSYPSADKIVELEDKISQIQKSSFTAMTVTWTFSPQADGSTLAACRMIVDHNLPVLATPMVEESMKNSLDVSFSNFAI